MENSEPVEGQGNPLVEGIQPESLLLEFRERSQAMDQRLDKLQELIQTIRGELHSESQASLHRLALAATDMANGRVYQQIDIQAKGELGALVQSLNTTLQNLQQLDASVKSQSTQVPELAAQLDAITADTEEATQSVMNRLDSLMASGDAADRAIKAAAKAIRTRDEAQIQFQSRLDGFLYRAQEGESAPELAQEILDFLFEQQVTSRLIPVDLTEPETQVKTISDEAFEILNTLQFQDITRQKVEKVVLLLKQFKDGLNRLLAIFNIEGPLLDAEVFQRRATATQERIFDTSLQADEKKESVDDIVAQFRKGKG